MTSHGSNDRSDRHDTAPQDDNKARPVTTGRDDKRHNDGRTER